MRSVRRITFLFFSLCTNEASIQNCLWRPFKPSPMFFGVIGFFGIKNLRCETTGLTWSNLDQISSRSFLWQLFLLHRLIFTLDFPSGFWWRLSSSSAPLAVLGSSPLITMIHTFCSACDGSWWPAGEFGIVSVIYEIVKYLSSSKSKPTFFPYGVNLI